VAVLESLVAGYLDRAIVDQGRPPLPESSLLDWRPLLDLCTSGGVFQLVDHYGDDCTAGRVQVLLGLLVGFLFPFTLSPLFPLLPRVVALADGRPPVSVLPFVKLAFVSVNGEYATVARTTAGGQPQLMVTEAGDVIGPTIDEKPRGGELGKAGESQIVELQGFPHGDVFRATWLFN
jgi:hypothetical protein